MPVRTISERKSDVDDRWLVDDGAGPLGEGGFVQPTNALGYHSHNRVPAIYQYRPFVEAGGLLSSRSDEADIYHLVGICAAKVLKDENPAADLPVEQ